MSMRSYAFNEITLDMKKAKVVAQQEYTNMMNIMQEEEPDIRDLGPGEVSRELSEAIDAFQYKVFIMLFVDIYPVYIPSDAEGLDSEYLCGILIWCIEPVYAPEIYNAKGPILSWTEIG